MTSLVATYLVFGLIGFFIASRVKMRPGAFGLILLATVVLLSQWVLPGTKVIEVLEFHMYANRVLQALSFGILVGLLSKKSA